VALYLLNILASFKDSSRQLNSILKLYASIPLIFFKCSISLFHLNAVLEKASDKSLSNNFSGKEHSNCSRFFKSMLQNSLRILQKIICLEFLP
ncbi:MAG: hypothetical protein RQ968_02060, partial [Thermoproteota archaeon]|nr:hypothetical protein [Thermoproteota archaeon]